MYPILREKNELLGAAAVELAAKLIRTPSPSLREQAVASQVETQMKQAGFDKVVRDSAGNIVGLMPGRSSEPTVLLVSHMDTVDSGKENAWTESPFSGASRNGKLFGLGASDCKAGLAAQIYAGSLLKRSLLPLRGNLIVAATVAEENGCGIGVRHLIETTLPELDLVPTYAILGEPTGLGLYYGHEGWAELEINVEGSNPFQVDDVAKAICDDLSEDAEDSSDDNREEGGVAFRNVHGLRCATIGLTRRIRAEEPTVEIVAQLQRQAERIAGSMGNVAVEVAIRKEHQTLYNGVTTVVRRLANAWATDPFHPLMERARQSLAAAGCEVRAGKWQLGRLGMGTAGGLLVNEFHLPTIGYGPGEEAFAHTPNECVEIARIAECVYGTAAIVHGLVGVPVYGWTVDEI
jgi:acetylornithine deacetylase/succinyl-diaminopimelate desuccinylase-like protein